MFFLRTYDEIEIQSTNEIVTFETHKRKGNKIKSVVLKQNQLIFKEVNLTTKLIPKQDKEIFNDVLIYILETENSQLIFQDPNNLCHFLVFNSDGTITSTSFLDLTEDDDILLYDKASENDYIISSIQNLYVVSSEENEYLKEIILKKLSNYVLYSQDDGIIINKIIITKKILS